MRFKNTTSLYAYYSHTGHLQQLNARRLHELQMFSNCDDRTADSDGNHLNDADDVAYAVAKHWFNDWKWCESYTNHG